MKAVHPDGRTQENVTVNEFFRTYGPAGFVPVEDATGNAAADEVVAPPVVQAEHHTDAILSAPDAPEHVDGDERVFVPQAEVDALLGDADADVEPVSALAPRRNRRGA